MYDLEELNLENFYKNMDERNELRNEGWGFAGLLSPEFTAHWTYKPEKLTDFFHRVKERYESDFAFLPKMVKMGYGSDSKGFQDVWYYFTQLDVCLNVFPLLLRCEGLSQDIMECMLFYVLNAMGRIEYSSFKME